MTLWLFMGFGAALLGGLVFFLWRGERAGRNAEKADNAQDALDAIDNAIKARDDSRADADKREQLRNKYRGT